MEARDIIVDVFGHLPVQGFTTKELKDLEANKLIIRIVHDGHPVAIEYKLTSHSFTLTPVVDEMIKWGKQHSKGTL
jgi:DNA-binding HxlR family transcriptional regulator